MSQINFQSLEDFVHRDSDDISAILLWYEKLSEYEIDGSESQKDISTLVYALRYLMNYSFTAAEELKEVAEKEAIAMAEKEEQWEEQRVSMKEEIEDLQQRITSGLDASESSEAFRAQIDNLKEENRILQQLSRDRDMEMADQRDRFEALVARADILARERDTLQDQKAQMEDNIRELTRRISSKSDDASQEWETKKLRLRQEQAVTLSRQMQAVVSQNDQLRLEVERVSDALEDATRLIEDSSRRIAELSNELSSSEKRETTLSADNRYLREKLTIATQRLEEVENKAMDSDEILKSKIQSQQENLMQLQQRFYETQIELEELRARVRADTTVEKEAELEKLKKELITATKMARTLLGQENSIRGGLTESTDWPRRLMQSEHRLTEAQAKIEKLQNSVAELEETIVQKELGQVEAVAELIRLRELKFGDAKDELARLEEQIRFRDEQITKLSRHCTMLQIELGRLADGIIPEISMKNLADPPKKESSTVESKSIDKISTRIPPKRNAHAHSDQKTTNPAIQGVAVPEVQQRPIRSLDGYEQQAMIIAGLNYELFSLLTEMEAKNCQLFEMEHAMKTAKKLFDEGSAKLKLAYEEIASQRKTVITKESTEKEENFIELMELRRFSESIRIGGTEAERRTEEVTRKLIAEKIQRLRLSKTENSLRFRFNQATEAARQLRAKVEATGVEGEKKLARLQYELDMAIFEMAAAQNKLIHSVPLKSFEKLSKKYRELLKKELLGGGVIDDPPNIDFDLLSSENDANSKEHSSNNEYLQKVVIILTEQNEFWKNETDILQQENDELKRFLEELENESEIKGLLVSIEMRLMETIRELSRLANERAQGKRKLREIEENLSRQRVSWSGERKHYFHIISLLQQSYQNQKNNNLASITVNQIEILQARVIDIGVQRRQIEEEKKESNKLHNEAETLKFQSEAEIKVKNIILGENGNVHRLEQLLRYHIAGETEQFSKVQRLEKLISLKEKQEVARLEEISDLQKTNEELLSLIAAVNPSRRENTVEKSSARTGVTTETDESAYEMDLDSNSSEGSPRVTIKTVIDDNSKEYEKRLSSIKETAETCIRSYQEQLNQKEMALESYKQLLLGRNAQTDGQKVASLEKKERTERDKETELKLRAALLEINRLKEEIEDLESANRELFRERRKSFVPFHEDISTQTDQEYIGTEREDRPSSTEQHPMTTIAEETERSELSESGERLLAQETAKHKQEIRRLQNRNRQLTTSNKELLAACEKIKEEAISQLALKKERSNEKDANELSQNRLDIIRLENEVRSLRNCLKEAQEAAEALRKKKEADAKNSATEVAKWERQKKVEEQVRLLRKRLMNTEDREKEATEKLLKREKRIEELQAEIRNRQKEVERLQKRAAEVKKIMETNTRDNQQVGPLNERVTHLEDRIKERNKDLSQLNTKLKSVEKQYQEVKTENKTLKTTLERAATISKEQRSEFSKPGKSAVNEKERNKYEEEQCQMKKQLRLAELRLQEAKEKLEDLEKDLKKAREDYANLLKRLNTREAGDSGATVVLKDKLLAKDREIAQLKLSITQLERRLSQ